MPGGADRYRADDAHHQTTRQSMDLLFARLLGLRSARRGKGVRHRQQRCRRRLFPPVGGRAVSEKTDHIKAKLVAWGGNASGVNVANIDNLGNVHPDTFWWHYDLGNVRRAPLLGDLAGYLRSDHGRPEAPPREIKGRCGQCRQFDICGGNTRVRAMQVTGDPWEEDPACYLTDERDRRRRGIESRRVEVTPYRGRKHAAAAQ